jgi:natural product precursor
MKKLTKLDIEALKKIMPVLEETEQSAVIGGLDPNDCWWRCIAYIKSCGTSFSSTDAMALASAYYGNNFSSTSYAFSGNLNDYQNYISNYVTNSGDTYCINKILVFNPNLISGWTGANGLSHAVIVQGYSGNSVIVFDPQNNQSGTIDLFQLNSSGAGFYINVN